MFEISTVGSTSVAFTNKKLQNATMAIFKIADNIRTRWFEVAAIVALVDSQELYKDDGFASVHEWVDKTFAFGKSRSYDLLKIGREYVRAVLNGKGKVIGYECNLLPEGVKDNFSTTQVTRMLPAGHDLAEKLVMGGEITPDMTTSAIAKVVKAHTNPDSNKSEESEEGTEKNEGKGAVNLLDEFTTRDLVRELNRRGFYVYDEHGAEVHV